MGTQLLLPKGGRTPPPPTTQFSAHVYCAQTVGRIKMPLGTKVGLGSYRIVLHGDPAPPSKRDTVCQFSAHVYCGQTVAHLSYCWALAKCLNWNNGSQLAGCIQRWPTLSQARWLTTSTVQWTSPREDASANVFVTVVDHRRLKWNSTRSSTPDAW